MNRNLTAEAEAANDTALPATLSDNTSLIYPASSTGMQHSLRPGRSSSPQWEQLTAPSHNILAGWAWAGHAAVSGGSAAAAVAAGAAALTWSALGGALGAEASAAALEGLAEQVKQFMMDGSSSNNNSVGAGSLNLPQSMQLATMYTGRWLTKRPFVLSS